ncbi:HNH endonuclease [Peredibacter sp. HCB2-198]|uniref:HNH endonuclease n=1 Tax=Peredibacter sp. HCB2-198 TaxID=3383025 RepID=UPI0038B69441
MLVDGMNLKHLTDKTLLLDTKKLAQEYRTVTAQLLHHLKEIEVRKLFVELGYSSMFNYVVQELGFSEPSAARRIKAARLLEEIPEIETKIQSGELNLTQIGMAANAFKQENITDLKFKKEVLATIENTSTRTCEKTLMEITGPNPAPKREVRPLTKTTNLLSVTLTDVELQIYEDLKGLVKNNFWDTVLKAALETLIAEKFKTTSTKNRPSNNPRYIPAVFKKAIYERDRKCSICSSQFRLEFDHITPFSHGGKTTKDNLRLLCRNCNQRQRIKQRL